MCESVVAVVSLPAMTTARASSCSESAVGVALMSFSTYALRRCEIMSCGCFSDAQFCNSKHQFAYCGEELT